MGFFSFGVAAHPMIETWSGSIEMVEKEAYHLLFIRKRKNPAMATKGNPCHGLVNLSSLDTRLAQDLTIETKKIIIVCSKQK